MGFNSWCRPSPARGLLVRSWLCLFGCFHELGVLFVGCPHNEGPTIWGLY